VTIKEIARRCGVSQGAVSYALNNQPGVSEATRARVLQVAATFGKQVRSRHPDLTERQKARVARLEPLAAAFGHVPLQAPETLDVDSQQRIG
jgi:transcriptional regulator with XRE-family HTH domain